MSILPTLLEQLKIKLAKEGFDATIESNTLVFKNYEPLVVKVTGLENPSQDNVTVYLTKDHQSIDKATTKRNSVMKNNHRVGQWLLSSLTSLDGNFKRQMQLKQDLIEVEAKLLMPASMKLAERDYCIMYKQVFKTTGLHKTWVHINYHHKQECYVLKIEHVEFSSISEMLEFAEKCKKHSANIKTKVEHFKFEARGDLESANIAIEMQCDRAGLFTTIYSLFTNKLLSVINQQAA